jgi:hypothetical protein
MNPENPLARGIVGSWVLARGDNSVPVTPRCIYHFASDGFNYWEMDLEGRRVIMRGLPFEYTASILTLTYKFGPPGKFEISEEADGSVKFLHKRGRCSWLVRLTQPEPYSLAFVSDQGTLERLETRPASDAPA